MHSVTLTLCDGTSLTGTPFGASGSVIGEVVFSTGMTGYPQSLTDPSFSGQILVFTYPLIGNYGVAKAHKYIEDIILNIESEKPQVSGVVVSTIEETPSHFELHQSLSDWLKKFNIPGISDIDTRGLTIKLRETGVMLGSIWRGKQPSFDSYTEPHFVSRVSTKKVHTYMPETPNGKHVALIDCGVKHGILRTLLTSGYKVTRVPWDFDPLDIPHIDGIVCSNGPGDPKTCGKAIENIRCAVHKGYPYLGICLGHQLLSLAIGADTYKLPYGHRGLNQPCLDKITNKAYVTSQNHGYAVKTSTIPKGYDEWFVNLNDGTNEGLRSDTKKVFSVQFHPEGNPGPFDTKWIIDLI